MTNSYPYLNPQPPPTNKNKNNTNNNNNNNNNSTRRISWMERKKAPVVSSKVLHRWIYLHPYSLSTYISILPFFGSFVDLLEKQKPEKTLVVFMLGGMTHEEMRVVYRQVKKTRNTNILIGMVYFWL